MVLKIPIAITYSEQCNDEKTNIEIEKMKILFIFQVYSICSFINKRFETNQKENAKISVLIDQSNISKYLYRL